MCAPRTPADTDAPRFDKLIRTPGSTRIERRKRK
jgi:hypothetical protein